MADYEEITTEKPQKWLVTGAAGFIGSHLIEALLKLGQQVAGMDNFETGYRKNLEEVRLAVGDKCWGRFELLEGDIKSAGDCQRACQGVDFVLHHAALGSVPRSLSDPVGYHDTNVTGFIAMLEAARQAKVRRFVYASSSAVYGDAPELPKFEDKIGQPLSPYAATKTVNEIYADVFGRAYGFESIGLRYFNVFGPRQDPNGAYAAVIPRWIDALLSNQPIEIYGDGETSRDFCYVDNVVRANILAATVRNPESVNQVYNIAVGHRTTLNELFSMLRERVGAVGGAAGQEKPVYREFREGDVRHSLADIGKAQRLLGYEPVCKVKEGLEKAVAWYKMNGGK
jgi:UDP-N-acetylglucosamine 4-epimerase